MTVSTQEYQLLTRRSRRSLPNDPKNMKKTTNAASAIFYFLLSRQSFNKSPRERFRWARMLRPSISPESEFSRASCGVLSRPNLVGVVWIEQQALAMSPGLESRFNELQKSAVALLASLERGPTSVIEQTKINGEFGLLLYGLFTPPPAYFSSVVRQTEITRYSDITKNSRSNQKIGPPRRYRSVPSRRIQQRSNLNPVFDVGPVRQRI